ncbi:MAG: ATP synthase F1 subunit delta [Lachnospiraceae bacterium]|nr:ATP synthase F1 subunit delta [Lachnospiraceae bacterium]
MAKLISNTYAEALFELAVEDNRIDDLYAQIDMLEKLFSENPEFIDLLTHPHITKEEKMEAIEKTLKGRVDDEVVGLLRVVTEKDRASEIGNIFENFRAKVYDLKKIGVVQISSAVGLSEAQKKKIEDKLLKTTGFKSLETHYSVDKDLIGGMVIRIGDRVVDSSVRSKIEKMTAELRKVSLK